MIYKKNAAKYEISILEYYLYLINYTHTKQIFTLMYVHNG